MIPCHVPPQYILSPVLHGDVVDPSVRANLSVKTWYIAFPLHCAGVAAMTTEASSRDSTARLNMSDMLGIEKRRGRDTGLSLCCGYVSGCLANRSAYYLH